MAASFISREIVIAGCRSITRSTPAERKPRAGFSIPEGRAAAKFYRINSPRDKIEGANGYACGEEARSERLVYQSTGYRYRFREGEQLGVADKTVVDRWIGKDWRGCLVVLCSLRFSHG